MINNPQTSFPPLVELGGEPGVSGASGPPPAPAGAAGAAQADAIGGAAAALGATLLDAAQSLAAAAQHGGLDPAAAAAQARARSGLEATLARMLGDAAGTPAGAPLANPALARTVLALALQPSQTSLPAGLPPRALAALLDAAASLRAAGAAATPAAAALALQRLAGLLVERRDDVAAAAAAIQTPATARGESAVAIPWWDPHFRAVHGSRAEVPHAGAREREDAAARLRGVPERDRRGRPYGPGRRARLAELGLDPRTGFAPEAETALAAEAQLGLRFARAADPAHDFVDEAGGVWDVVAPHRTAGLEVPLRALARDANVLADAAFVDSGDVPALAALVERLAQEERAYRIVVVGEDEAGRWP